MNHLKNGHIRVYHGYGHMHNLLVYGHVFAGKPPARKAFTANRIANLFRLIRLFGVKPIPGIATELHWDQQRVEAVSENDGFLKFEWKSARPVPAGWHPVSVSMREPPQVTAGKGSLYVPHITQYGFISDIDDTIMISHSATIGKRMRELFYQGPLGRKLFDDVAEHYRLLSLGNTRPDEPNPFFYVSSSEWNLYDYLLDVFRNGGLPEGAFLLSQVKRWYQLLKTGKTKHRGKLLRVLRIMDAFPNQRFILLGDNTQSDPAIYAELAEKYPERVFAIYIRNVYPATEPATRELLTRTTLNTGVHHLLFRESREAIAHSRSIGLITKEQS